MTSATNLKELQDSALEHLWVYLREPSDMAEKGEPVVYVSGEGVRVTDAQGNTSIDGMSGLWLKNVGYGRKEIADAAYEQMLKLTYMPMGTTTEPTIRLAEKVAEITPGDLSRSFFTSGEGRSRLRRRSSWPALTSSGWENRAGSSSSAAGTPTTAPPPEPWPWAATISIRGLTTNR